MRFTFFYLLPILGIAACQSSSTPPVVKNTMTCYIRVLEAEGQIRAEATMNTPDPAAEQGVRPIEVEDIRYQNSPMSVIPNQGLTYVKEYAGEYLPEHTFSWKGSGATKERTAFTLQMNAIKNFGFGTKKLSKSQPATFTWEGGGLEKGEALVLLWERAKDNLTVPMEMLVQGGLPQIDFPAAKMAQLSPGIWTLYVVRKKMNRSEVAGIPVQTIMEFYSKTETITITD